MPTIRALISATVFSLTTAIAFSSATAAAPQEHPSVMLPEAVQGEAAIAALGNSLPAVAAAHNMSVAQFARAIRTDDTMWLDTKGRVFYVEPDLAIPANEDLHLAADYPLSQTFALASRPDSPITIYLDFDGHVLQNTAWNNSTGNATINAKPWTQDSDSNTFTTAELAAIQNIWRMMAEDFAAFDVNVTTIAPDEADLVKTSSSDTRYGTRVLFTPNDFYSCSCGGVAYVGVFDSVINPAGYYQPALVFNTGTKGAAEAGSHEAGHNVGLSHDGTSALGYYGGHGTGETGWAPIMGVGYSKSLVQWSKGEYLDANNTQDDYAVMANNGLFTATDDYGSTRTTASYLDESVTGIDASATGSGIIGTPSDIDGFLIVAGAGTLSVQADPVSVSPNLDIGLAVYDLNSNLVASANPTDLLAASLSTTVAGGEYLITVTGVGKGDPLSTGYSDYGSLGGAIKSPPTTHSPVA